jgi:acyl-CoA dehydrogenase
MSENQNKTLKPYLSSQDLTFLFADFHDKITERLVDFAANWQTEHEDDWLATKDAIADLSKHEFTKLCVPEQFGGEAVENPNHIDIRAVTLAREALAWSNGLLDCAFAMQGLGSYPITLAGNEAQKKRYLPGIISGERIGAFALTEPNAGSDVGSMECKAKKQENGDYIISGTKTFISNAGVATQYIVFASTDPKLKNKGISAFIVDANEPGIKIEPFELLAPHPIGTIHFKRCRVPESARLGQEGQGFKIAMQTLDTFRISVAGAALGMARRALDEGLRYSIQRQQFQKPLIEQQQIAAYLADSATELDAARLLVYRAANLKDLFQESLTKEVAMAKLFATETAQRIIDKMLQIHGGLGVKKGNPLERLYREVRALRIYEGASEIQKLMIAKQLRKDFESQ